jgi:outer membrane lipoprotein-sorting protein
MHRKSITLVAVALLVVAGLGPTPLAQGTAPAPSVDDLVAKNLQAKGGIERIKSVQTFRQTGRMTMQGIAATITITAKRPNLLRQEIVVAGKTIVNGFDGTTPWLVNPLTGSTDPIVVGGPEADAIREQADLDGPLVDYKTKGYAIEYVGLETVNGRSVQHLKLTGPTRRIQHCYLDATTGLEFRIVSEAPAGSLEQELTDFRDVEGLKVPFGARTLANGVLLAELTFDRVEFNVPLDILTFKVPVKKDVLTYSLHRRR